MRYINLRFTYLLTYLLTYLHDNSIYRGSIASRSKNDLRDFFRNPTMSVCVAYTAGFNVRVVNTRQSTNRLLRKIDSVLLARSMYTVSHKNEPTYFCL